VATGSGGPRQARAGAPIYVLFGRLCETVAFGRIRPELPEAASDPNRDDSSIVLLSPLPLTEARLRLRQQVRRWRALGWAGRDQAVLVGGIRGDRLRLVVSRSLQNSWEGRFVGRLTEDAGGTRVEGTVRTHPFVAAFMLVWCVLGAVMLVGGATLALVQGDLEMLMALLVGGAFFGLIGYALPRVGKYLARHDRDDIARMLAQILDADERRPPGRPRRSPDCP
jgi:hypothetical protein